MGVRMNALFGDTRENQPSQQLAGHHADQGRSVRVDARGGNRLDRCRPRTRSSSQNDGTPSLSVQQVSRQVGSGDFDAARVEQIRAAIQDGTLKMDASKIADGVLSDAQSLLSAQTRPV